jgi:hypothetical protein
LTELHRNEQFAKTTRYDGAVGGEWRVLRARRRDEAKRWLDAQRVERDLDTTDLTGVVGSIADLAYHLGAIRQINRAARGPSEEEVIR